MIATLFIAAAILFLGPLVVAWLIGGTDRMHEIFDQELEEN